MSRAELIVALRALSGQMLEVASALDYYGGLASEATRHASELAGAAGIVETWADGLAGEA